MTDVIGHDCDGRPLRVGDRVVSLVTGGTGNVTQVEPNRGNWHPDDRNCLEYQLGTGAVRCVDDRFLRKLPDDKPAGQSFEELMNQLNKEGATT